MNKKGTGNVIVEISTDLGLFYGEVLKVTSYPKKRSIKVKIKSFSVPTQKQHTDIHEYFKKMLNFSEDIDLHFEGFVSARQVHQHIELLNKSIQCRNIKQVKCYDIDDILFFDVKNTDESRHLNDFIQECTPLTAGTYKINVREEQKIIQKPIPKEQPKGDSKHIYGRKKKYDLIKIKEVDERSGGVMLRGHVLASNIIHLRSGKGFLVIFSITDYTSSIGAKLFLKNDSKLEAIKRIQKGIYIQIEGHAQVDKRSGELQISAESLSEKEYPKETDTAQVKRIELHLHTKISAMDGVVELKQLIKRVSDLGHRAVAITDHGSVQAFPEAAELAPKAGIKVLYGLECYLFDDSNPIVENGRNYALDKPFVVFDLETTGLSARTDEILEIAAVKIQNGKVLDTYQSYVYTDHEITPFITKLTGISRRTITGAPTIDVAMDEFISFAGDCVIAAHNSSFDMSFVNAATNKINKQYHPTCIDTLALSRAVLENMRSYKLNTICKKLHIKLDNHHTALADATATAQLLTYLFNIVKSKEIDDVLSMNMQLGTKAMGRDNIYHAIIFAKNKKGLKALYEIVSISHQEYLFRGKPSIPKSLLVKKRENLLVGSACEAGELYSAIHKNKNQKEIKQIAAFYDYYEIQPLGNNEFMVRDGIVNDNDALIDTNKKIIALGEKNNKPVVATGDVHFLYPRDEYIRRILMHGQKYQDADLQAPLYYRTTQQMLNEFDYLDSDKAYEVVVANPNLICDMIEDMQPLPPYKLYPPYIEGAEDEVLQLSYEKAHEIYGETLPEIVKNRLEKELNSITGHGYSVLYLIAHKLVKKSNDDGYLVGSRGSVGSSFVAYVTGITEVNPLPSHYTCSGCKHSDFNIDIHKYSCGPDMPDKQCPECGKELDKQGFDIPFEVFLGFEGDKVPDIDLNFSGEYQPIAHKYTETLLGAENVFRAGTISSIAQRTAYGFVKGYLDDKGIYAPRAEIDRLVDGLSGVKRTTGQHPGGIIVVPSDMDIHDFTPIQYPADDKDSGVVTTHFDFNSMHDRLVKLDILGHDDPTMLKMLNELTGIDPASIPLDDKETMSLFSSTNALGVSAKDIGSQSGTFGIPEFGTRFVREMLVDTQPKTFAELVRISGLSHGTDVWLGNARDLILTGKATLLEAICTRDDIMNALIDYSVDPKMSFDIMEDVRKGKGLKDYMEEAMMDAKVPEWFINSCKMIQYMFPKAHAVAYVMMGFRVAYYKVNYAKEYYTAYFTVRADDFDAQLMLNSKEDIKREIDRYELEQRQLGNKLPNKDKRILTILEIVLEMKCRGIDFESVDIYRSDATQFLITDAGILPPLNAMPGLGDTAAQSVVEARKEREFSTIEQLRKRAKLNKSVIELLKEQGCIDELPESDQVSMFDMV
ncbi:MAG: PolC-type DNA polymerase III [Clostridiales bacterium]|nr:PolC-type DNA polymerase III [Clostridiales bacterium]